MTKKTKRRNPQDATRVNVRAANKRLTAVESRVQTVERVVLGALKRLEGKVDAMIRDTAPLREESQIDG